MLEEVGGYLGKPYDGFEDQHITRKLEVAGYKIEYMLDLQVWHTFRRFKDGLRGYMKYMATEWSAEDIYPDHLSDDSPYSVAVIVPVFNANRTITACLESLLAQQPAPNDIIVVDMNSTDQTADTVQRFITAHPQANVRMVQETGRNIGQAWRAGRSAVTTDIAVQVRPDQGFPKNWLATVHAVFICDAELGVIGGEVRPQATLSVQGLTLFARNLMIRWRNRKSAYLADSMLAYRRDLVRPAATDLCSEVAKAGYKVRFKPDLHTIRQSS